MDRVGDGRRVLVVEDNALEARQSSKALANAGYHVEVAGELAQARELLRPAPGRRPFDVVLLELKLPNGDGADLLTELTELDEQPAVAVVTGHLDSMRKVELLGWDVVPKPLPASTLLATVDGLLRLRGVDDSTKDPRRGPELSSSETRAQQAGADGQANEDAAGKPCLGKAVPSTFGRFCAENRLSFRERAALAIAAQGGTDEETARALGCSRGTVATYWSRIRAKTGKTKKTEVVAALLAFACPDLYADE